MRCLFTVSALLASTNSFAVSTVEELAKLYADAHIEQNSEAVSDLYWDAWDECKYPEYNKVLHSDHFEQWYASEIFKNYSIELTEVESSSPDDSIYKNVTYFPVEPTHTLAFKLNSKEKASISYLKVRNIQGTWYFIHHCADDDFGKLLEAFNAKETEAK